MCVEYTPSLYVFGKLDASAVLNSDLTKEVLFMWPWSKSVIIVTSQLGLLPSISIVLNILTSEGAAFDDISTSLLYAVP